MIQSFHGDKIINSVHLLCFSICLLTIATLQKACIVVSATEEVNTLEKSSLNDLDSTFCFSNVEETGSIRQFAVSSSGQIVTCIGASSLNFNIYDTYGYYDYTIYTNITRNDVILRWEENTLLIYLHFSGIINESYRLMKVNGYKDYEVIDLPVNEKTEELWSGLPQNTSELITNDSRYYLHYGNLMYEDLRNGENYAVTENTSFHPLMLLSIPILAAIIWFGIVRKKVKQWEEKRNKS